MTNNITKAAAITEFNRAIAVKRAEGKAWIADNAMIGVYPADPDARVLTHVSTSESADELEKMVTQLSGRDDLRFVLAAGRLGRPMRAYKADGGFETF